ncbi:21229_t:CDS:2 [Cetraspora pellucida]|uniref:21229_t:CDS:1 n=1 Tax=Cetraspora pellucida TaxID=1433469 RepID=A0A9N8WJJ4_9GLOM|nr:21229_t:CDS:2 [Cetraspora pellucida]
MALLRSPDINLYRNILNSQLLRDSSFFLKRTLTSSQFLNITRTNKDLSVNDSRLYKTRRRLIKRTPSVHKISKLKKEIRMQRKDSSKLDQVIELERKRLKEVSKKIWEKQPPPPQYLYNDARTEQKVEKYIEWKKLNENIPLRLIKTFLSSYQYIKVKSHGPKQAFMIFKELLLNKDQLKDVPFDDIQRLAGYFAKVHPRNAIFVLEAALEHGFKLSYSDYHMLIVLYGKIQDRIGAIRTIEEMKRLGFELTSEDYCDLLQCIMNNGSDILLAKKYLNEMKSKNLHISYNAYVDLINGFVEHNDIRGAGQLFIDMLQEGLAAPNIFMPNDQNSDKSAKSNNLTNWEKTLLEQIYIIFIQTFVHNDNLHQAKKYYDKLLDINSAPDPEIVNIIINSCLNRGEIILAKQLLKRTVTTNVESAYMQIFKKCIQEKNFLTLWTMYEQALDKEIPLSKETYYFLILHCCHEGSSTDAYILYNDARSKGFLADNLYVHNKLLQILVNNGCHSNAQKILREMTEDLGLSPNLDTYRIIIQMAAKKQDSKEIEKIFHEMKELGYSVDQKMAMQLISCLVASGEIEKSKQTIKLMKMARIHPTITNYNILMKAYSNISIKEVLNIFNRIRKERIVANAETYNILIESFMAFKDYINAKKMYNSMRENYIRPSIETFHILLRHIFETKGIEVAEKVFEDQVNANIFEFESRRRYVRPTVHTWNIMLEYAYESKNSIIIAKIYKKMREHGIKLIDLEQYIKLISFWVERRDFFRAEDIINHIRIGRFDDNFIVKGYNEMMEGCLEHGEYNRAERLWKMIEYEKRKETFQKEAQTKRQIDMEARMRRGLPTKRPIQGVEHVIAVASGKGGVGKSTLAINLALAIASFRHRVGILDADIFGPSIPRLLNLKAEPQTNEKGELIPLVNFGVKAMSMGFIIGEDSPVVMKALQQLLHQVQWGGLDLLVIDMPPGTGDTQLTISQQVVLDGVVIVSTPQDIALIDARKGANMFTKVNVPILGMVQNMSIFVCPNCQHKVHIFGQNGVLKTSKEMGLDYLGDIPLDADICELSDFGTPVVVTKPDSYNAQCYKEIAKKIMNKINLKH